MILGERLDALPRVEEYRILVSVDAMRPAAQVGREILAELEAMRTLVDYVPEHLRRPIDLTGLDAAFGHITTDIAAQR